MEREKVNLEDAMGSVKNVARETAASTERATDRMGEALGSVGDSIRQNLPGSGTMSEAAEAVSRTVRKTAEYFQEEGMSGIVEDLELLIRRYPLQTLLLGMGCGYLLSRLRSE